MDTTISQFEGLPGIIFEPELLELAKLKVGEQVNVEVHPGGIITITPLHPPPTPDEISRAIQFTMTDYAQSMQNLA